MTPKIRTKIWVSALIARASVQGSFASILCKGDEVAGAVLVIARNIKTNEQRLYRPARNLKGEPIWLRGKPQSEAEIKTVLDKRRAQDPDMWIIEVEDGAGRPFLTEAIEDL